VLVGVYPSTIASFFDSDIMLTDVGRIRQILHFHLVKDGSKKKLNNTYEDKKKSA
jgi:hypothetical protein